MQQQLNACEVYVVILAQPGLMDKKYRDMKPALAKKLIGLGTTQFIVGILCVIFQAVSVWLFDNASRSYHIILSFAFVGHGFWIGITVSKLKKEYFILSKGL